ncbi:MAG: AsmA-like C-terminal region-containing protein [Candidatus Binatia bacterium]
MRRLAWILAILALLATAIAGIAAAFANRIIAQNRERILEQIRTTIGRPVSAERMVVNLCGGIGVRVEQVRVADDPRFSTGDFVAARAVVAQAKLLPLLHGELDVGRIELQAPHIALHRDAHGRWNFESIGRQALPLEVGSPSATPAGHLSPDHIPLIIGRANIADGTITLTDATQSPPRVTVLSQIDLSVGDVGGNTSISFDLSAALQAENRNIRLRGSVGPLANSATIPLRIDGTVGPLGPQALRIDSLHLEAVVAPASVRFSTISGRAFDGHCTLTGEIPRRADGPVALKGECAEVAIGKILRLGSDDAARRIEGDGTLRFDLRATGNTAEAIRSSVAGQAEADLAHGEIRGVNVVRDLLGRLSNLPVVGDLVSRSVKARYTMLAADPDTHLRSLHATFRIADQRLHTDNLSVDADDFAVRATGWIGFDQDADLLGVLTMSQAFSRDVVSDVKEARFLLDDQGRLAVPFRLRGRLGVAKPQPDTAYLVARLSQGIGSGGLKDLLGRLLGPPQDATPAHRSEGAGGSIERGLRSLFGR